MECGGWEEEKEKRGKAMLLAKGKKVGEGGREGKLLQGVIEEDSKRLAYGEALK